MKTGFVITIFLLLTMATSVVAQQAGPPPDRFTIHDLNRDGLLDRHEYSGMFLRWQQRHLDQNKPEFSEIDRDANGYITEDELIKVLNQQLRHQRRFRAREHHWSQEGY
jgi:Ca2+-binding EF-hand superfamily protein